MHDLTDCCNQSFLPLPLNSMSKTQQLCVMNAFSHYRLNLTAVYEATSHSHAPGRERKSCGDINSLKS